MSFHQLYLCVLTHHTSYHTHQTVHEAETEMQLAPQLPVPLLCPSPSLSLPQALSFSLLHALPQATFVYMRIQHRLGPEEGTAQGGEEFAGKMVLSSARLTDIGVCGGQRSTLDIFLNLLGPFGMFGFEALTELIYQLGKTG